MSPVIGFELIGLLAALGALATVTRPRFAVAGAARFPLVLLLCLFALNHVANVLEQLGHGWADAAADTLSGAPPLLWALFLLEVGRGFLTSRMSVQNQQLRFLLERVPAAVAWLDANRTVRAASRAWDKAFPDSFGRALDAALPGALPRLDAILTADTTHGFSENHGEDRLESENGARRYFRWAVRRFAPNDGDRAGSLLILEETTARVEAEAARATAVEELARAQRAADLGQLSAAAAHDFNNILQVIGCAAEELEEIPRARSVAGDIRQAIGSASAMTRAMLRFGSDRKAQRAPLDLVALVTQVEGLLKILLGRHHALHVSKPDNPIVISGSGPQLEHAILNLLVNARDAMPNGGTIELGLEVRDGLAWISVKDGGVGMSEAVRAQLFKPFFTTKGARGTGLGLLSVENAAREHGGNVSVDSSPGAGSTFRLSIPLDREPSTLASTLPPLTAPARASKSPIFGGPG